MLTMPQSPLGKLQMGLRETKGKGKVKEAGRYKQFGDHKRHCFSKNTF